MQLEQQTLSQFIQHLVDETEGKWLLVGGALVALWLHPRRMTEDLDLVGLSGTNEERLKLMNAAAAQGLPIEAVNSAAEFFVRRIDDWLDQIEIFIEGKKGIIYRPTPTLFLLLKISRLSEQDLEDCITLLAYTKQQGWSVDRDRILGEIDRLKPTDDHHLMNRRLHLKVALES